MLHTCMYVNTHLCKYSARICCSRALMYVCVCVYVCTCVYVCIYYLCLDYMCVSVCVRMSLLTRLFHRNSSPFTPLFHTYLSLSHIQLSINTFFYNSVSPRPLSFTHTPLFCHVSFTHTPLFWHVSSTWIPCSLLTYLFAHTHLSFDMSLSLYSSWHVYPSFTCIGLFYMYSSLLTCLFHCVAVDMYRSLLHV